MNVMYLEGKEKLSARFHRSAFGAAYPKIEGLSAFAFCHSCASPIFGNKSAEGARSRCPNSENLAAESDCNAVEELAGEAKPPLFNGKS